MKCLTVTLTPSFDVVLSLPRLIPNEAVRAEVALRYAGGKGNNVARALARLGQEVVATGFQGGHTGMLCKEQLALDHVKIDFVECRNQTRTTVIVQEQLSDFSYVINEPGQLVEPAEANELLTKFNLLIPSANICLLCGSGEAPSVQHLFAQMIQIARRHQVRCLLDSSGSALKNALEAKPYLVKVNAEELGGYLNRRLDNNENLIQALRELIVSGIQLAAISLGAKGMLATDGHHFWHGQLTMPRVTNIVGCGDAAMAGMALAINSGYKLPEIVRWGVACGAANTQTSGACFIQRQTVEALLNQVELQTL